MKVLVRAPLLTNSGYGVHSRQVFEWLLEKSKKLNFQIDVECLNWGLCPWIIDEKRESGLIREVMLCSRKIEPPYDVTFQVQLPDEWDPQLGKYNVGVTAAVETDRCNPKWVDFCNKMDTVVVPSTFTKNVLRRSGILTTDIKVIPEWYHDEIASKELVTLKMPEIKTRFNFLTVGMLTDQSPDADRKNIYNTIRIFCENFKNNKEVGLVVKTSLGKYSSFDRKKTNEYFRKIIDSARGKNEFPKVYLLHGSMSKKEISSLYCNDKINAYLTLTRGEGYGLPLIEAAASGLPIIATNHSGHLEFLKKGSFLGVDYVMVEVPKKKTDNRIFIEGTKWAEPDKESCFTKMNEAYYNYESCKQIAEDYSIYIRSNYSKDSVKKMYDNTFKDVL